MSNVRESNKRSKDLKELITSNKRQCSTSSSGLSGAMLLKELRDDVKKREEEDKAAASATLIEKQRQHNVKILNSLVLVSDALRSHFISSNRSVLSAAECYKSLADTLKCSKVDVKEAVIQISLVVPELLTIIPADSILSYRTIKLDFQRPYTDNRNTIVEYVRMKLADS